MSLYLAEIADCLDLNTPGDRLITNVSIDTREIKAGGLFVALSGTRVDGYDFIPDAVANGAEAILCTRSYPNITVPQLIYPDLEKALGLIATAYREKLACRVVAITGSNGKTTVKEMLASILSEVAPTFATPGNKNNHLGVPLSVLQVKDTHQYAVFELGANHAGEILHTVRMVKPHVALINNIGTAHIEGFGSMDGIARAKGEIYEGLLPEGTAIINADDAYAAFWDDLLQNKKVLRFSSADKKADVLASKIHPNQFGAMSFNLKTPNSSCTVQLVVQGKHHVQNALAAATCACALGVSLDKIATGLSKFEGVSGRLMPKVSVEGAVILDDTYNANLNSVLAGIDVLAAHAGKRILVLGDMGELGEHMNAHHAAVGDAAKNAGIEGLLTCGTASLAATHAFGKAGRHFDTQAALLQALKPALDAETTVLVKGSRRSAMEKVVQHLLA